jgi:hypothetical protein
LLLATLHRVAPHELRSCCEQPYAATGCTSGTGSGTGSGIGSGDNSFNSSELAFCYPISSACPPPDCQLASGYSSSDCYECCSAFDPFYFCEEQDDDIILEYYDGYYVIESNSDLFDDGYALGNDDSTWAFWGRSIKKLSSLCIRVSNLFLRSDIANVGGFDHVVLRDGLHVMGHGKGII